MAQLDRLQLGCLERKDAMVDAAVSEFKVPVTDRGRRTRSRLVEAAREVFEESGFLEARITDIAEAAGVAYGTFYTYFSTKEEIFREVAREIQQDFLRPREQHADDEPELDLHARIERANRRYLEGYLQNARIMAVIEQVATFNDDLLVIRREMREAFVQRSTRAIARWQAGGLVDPALDPYYAANALGSMIDRFAYVWLVLGGDFELEPAVDNLTRLWVNALQLQPRRPADRRPRPQAAAGRGRERKSPTGGRSRRSP